MTEIPLALVTGAAHRLGRAFALALAQQGYAILLHHHSSVEEANRTAREIRSLGVPVQLVQADLTDEQSISSLFEFLDSLHYPLKVLVNSAAVMHHHDVDSMTAKDWDATFDLNLRAPFLLAKGASDRMEDGGLIVNITDVGAHKLWTSYLAYAVSKSALERLTLILAKAYAPKIRVNAIAPGLVFRSEGVSPEEWEKLVNRLPLKRLATPEEVTGALEFLVKNESVTGQTIVVDGGYTLV